MAERGKFFVFEGVGSAGKGTQSQYAYDLLIRNGYDVVLTREPGGTTGGEIIRQLIFKLKRADLITSGEQMVLFFASRKLLITELIEPSIEQGIIVLGDRFFPSTKAYQGCAEGGDIIKIESLIRIALDDYNPDAIFFLDIEATTALSRFSAENANDPFDRTGLDYTRRVVSGYREMARTKWRGINWYTINGELEVNEVSMEVKAALEDVLNKKLS